MKRKWWQDAIIYQLYIRSFKDSNNDGIGDFQGIISKLDYFTDLGVDALWISPHYESPMDDNGYDISDFYKVSKDYGTIEDVKELIEKAHKRNIKIIFDLVLNHTSDEMEKIQIIRTMKNIMITISGNHLNLMKKVKELCLRIGDHGLVDLFGSIMSQLMNIIYIFSVKKCLI